MLLLSGCRLARETVSSDDDKTVRYAPRVVNVTSAAHHWSDVHYNDPNFDLRAEEYEPCVAAGNRPL